MQGGAQVHTNVNWGRSLAVHFLYQCHMGFTPARPFRRQAAFSVPVEPLATRQNMEASVLSAGNEADDDTVEIEL